MTTILKRICIIASLLLFSLGLLAQESSRPTIAFVNQSGNNCLVKLVGPTGVYLDVPNGMTKTVSVSGGQYYIVTRYGEAGRYRYSRGDAFSVTETVYGVSRISITLHKVANGNYETRPDSGKDF